MVHLDKLKQLTTTKYSGVKSVKKQIHLALEPRFLDNIKFGILKHLNNHLHEYFPEVSGVLLGYEDVKLKKSTGALYTDQPHIHVDIQAIFFVFCPSPGSYLLGTVNKKSAGHVGVLVHDTINASILKTDSDSMKSWAGAKVSVGKTVKFKVLSVSYSKNRLVLLGDLNQESMHVGDVGAVVEIIEEVSELDVDSEYDSGIENGNQKKKQQDPVATEIVNGEVSGSKRKAEDDVEDEVERKRRRKAEKKAKKERERLEGSNQMANGNGGKGDSNDELKDVTPKPNISSSSSFTPLLAPDLLALKTPKSKEKSLIASPKTPRENFELPEGFKVIEKKTEKKSWKIYQGPDGKNYRSMAEIKRHIDSCTFDEKKLADTIEFVSTDWNCSEKGDLGSDKEKFYSANFKDFPKSELYFVDIKPRKTVVEISETIEVPAAAVTVVDNTFTGSSSLNGTHEDSTDKIEKKKKKKKKNKHKEATLE